MKKIALSLITFCLFACPVMGQYNCSKFYPFSEGATSQLSLYDGKGNKSGMVEYHIKNVSSSGDTDKATMVYKLIDDKGNTLSGSEYEVTCRDGIVFMDFRSLMRPQMLEQYKGMKREVTGTNLNLPNNLSVGQSLPDATMNIKISIEGMNLNMNTSIIDRKVIGTETLTTPAGTFSCYVIGQTMIMKTMGTHSRSSKQWIAEGVGVVKSEDYNKRGKLTGSSVLSNFSK